MNIIVKTIIIIINIVIIVLCLFWYKKIKDIEPLTVIGGQISTILVLIFETQISKMNIIKRVSNTKIDLTNSSDKNSMNKISRVRDSEIKIKNK